VKNRKTSPDHQSGELKLDLTGLLGADRVFDAAADPSRQAELIDANCNKIGSEVV